jgi:hypothetical protein
MDPAEELLRLQREQAARREANGRDIRHGVAAFIIITIVVLILMLWLAHR